ncbi:MAG TPA: hypothetical protein VMY42_05075 [Thermoguttaceae bacterium]|nr:hypothetical protein [Thermoguttaceae bacterium]
MPPPEVLLVTTPSVDFHNFLIACGRALGYSPASAADASGRNLSDLEKFLSCLAALRDQQARVGPAPKPNLLPHVSFGVFVVADERDMRDILECCSGMSFVTADTLAPRVLAAVITGTLAQWRDAVAAGSVREAEPSVRKGFNRIHNLFYGMNLNVWGDYNIREVADSTFFMECKRRR